LENRQQEELAELQQRLDKEMQALHVSLARELDADSQHQAKERERAQKAAVASEAKRRKHIQQLHEMEMKQLHQQQKREYQRNKEEMRKVLYRTAADVKFLLLDNDCCFIIRSLNVYRVYSLLLGISVTHHTASPSPFTSYEWYRTYTFSCIGTFIKEFQYICSRILLTELYRAVIVFFYLKKTNKIKRKIHDDKVSVKNIVSVNM